MNPPIQELTELSQKGLLRKIRTLSQHRGIRASWEGRELLLFCGNDYLGLSRHPQTIQAALKAIEEYGVGAGAARLISGTRESHTRLEEELAHFKLKERALVFGSGYLANLGVLSALAGEEDLIVMDKLSHASLIDGAKLSGAVFRVFPHKNYARCKEILKNASGHRRRILVSDAVFSMDGDLADLEELVRLKEKYEGLLVIDDAHGIGVFGARGEGATEGFEEKIDVIVGTLSKSLGAFGGFAAASGILIEYLINVSRPFIFSTALPAPVAAAALEALQVIQTNPSLRGMLWQNVERVAEFLEGKGEFVSPIFPLIVGKETEALRISEELLKRGILIPAVRYPTVPRGRARLRLTVSATHTEEDLEKLFQALSELFRR